MKVFLDRTMSKEALGAINCNMCGREIVKNDFGYFEDYLPVSKTWGYGTALDGETHSFNLCIECYTALTESFVLPMKVEEVIYDTESAM